MIHLVKTRNNGPRCIEYRVYLLTSISRFSTTRFKLGKCTTFENWSIIALVDFKTCPIIDKLLLLGRLLIRLTSSSTFFMKSSISSLPDLDMPDRAIFILAARMPFLSVRSNLLSSKLSSAWMHTLIGITRHFRASLQLFLHAFLQGPWEHRRTGIHDGV